MSNAQSVNRLDLETMTAAEYRQAQHIDFCFAMDAYIAVAGNNNSTMAELIAADNARQVADIRWIDAQHTANQMAQAELDAITAKGCGY